MIDALKTVAFIVVLLGIMILPIYGAIKYSMYKSAKYYKLLASDLGLTFTEEDFFGIKGDYKSCTIKVYNDTVRSFSKKYQCVKIQVSNTQLRVIGSSIKEIKSVKLVNGELPINNFYDYFEVKLPANIELDTKLKEQLMVTAIELGFEDNLELKQNEPKTWNALQSFTLTTKNRYNKCKLYIELMVNINLYLVEQQKLIPSRPIN